MAIYITKNQNNAIYCTINDTKVLSGTTYHLMEIYSKNSLNSKIIRFSGDVSYNPVRYSQFALDEVEINDEDLDNAKVNLELGEYVYSIFETNLSSGTTITNLSPIETGLLIVEGDDIVTKTEYNVKKEYKFFK